LAAEASRRTNRSYLTLEPLRVLSGGAVCGRERQQSLRPTNGRLRCESPCGTQFVRAPGQRPIAHKAPDSTRNMLKKVITDTLRGKKKKAVDSKKEKDERKQDASPPTGAGTPGTPGKSPANAAAHVCAGSSLFHITHLFLPDRSRYLKTLLYCYVLYFSLSQFASTDRL
jgi:hypothetical protein